MAREIINGVPNQFGVPVEPSGLPSVIADDGVRRTIALPFKYDNLPTNSTNDAGVLSIPAHAQIVDARLETKVAFAGGTSYDIGLVQSDGTAIDVDGLFAALALASINAKGKWANGAGALVGAGIGANAGQIKVTATGTFTAGEARLLVTYIPASVA